LSLDSWRRASRRAAALSSSINGGKYAADYANDNVFDLNAILHPGTVFDHPRDVVQHLELTLAEKRAILASWASDASAIGILPRHACTIGTQKTGDD